MKLIIYIIIPVILVIVVKEFLLNIKMNTKEAVQIGMGLVIIMWIVFFVLNRLLNRTFRQKNVAPQGFQITHKKQSSDSQHKDTPRKFYALGGFQIIHKGQTDETDDDRVFKIPLYKKRPLTEQETMKKPGQEQAINKQIEKGVHFGTAGIRGLTNIEITPLMVLKMSEIYGSYLPDCLPAFGVRAGISGQAGLSHFPPEADPRLTVGQVPMAQGSHAKGGSAEGTGKQEKTASDNKKTASEKPIRKIKIAIGYDSRYGSDMLKNAAISGLNSAGVHTINCGCITTGGLASYIVCNKLDGGILITGSHTPYNMTGFIILNSDGSYLDIEHSRELENRFENYEKFRAPVKPEQIGNNQEAQNPFDCYKSFLLERTNHNLIKPKHYRVLVDPANGPATLILPDLLKELSCSVFSVNEKLSPIPNRPSEPRAKNLIETAAKVKEYKCDLGIATDVDADRVLFIDAEGKVLSEDLVGAIFARSVISSSPPEADPRLTVGQVPMAQGSHAKGGSAEGTGKQEKTASEKTCVVPINSSFLIEEVISKCGGRLEYCRIGQPETIKAIKQCGASFSYEESGKYYFCNDAMWPDSILSSLKLLEIMAKHNKPLDQIASEFPQFYQVKHNLSYESLISGSDEKRIKPNINSIFQKTQELWKKEYLEGSVKDAPTGLLQEARPVPDGISSGEQSRRGVRDVTIDGLKRIYNDKSWLLIRKSGTESLIRVYADAPTYERANQLVELGEELIKKAVAILLSFPASPPCPLRPPSGGQADLSASGGLALPPRDSEASLGCPKGQRGEPAR